ncbi:MAG: phosphoribosyltransferase family protein [Thermomicrobiales bacterium]
MLASSLPLDSSVLAYLKQDGVLREGHFAFRSGRHALALLDRDRLLTNPRAASHMGYALAKTFFTEKIETVAAPSIWGAGLAQWVAYYLEPQASVVYATPTSGNGLVIADNLSLLLDGRRVLLVDNVTISGQTVETFARVVQERGGTVVGVGTLWDGAGLSDRSWPVVGLLNQRYPAFTRETCPGCRDDAHEHAHEPESIPY